MSGAFYCVHAHLWVTDRKWVPHAFTPFTHKYSRYATRVFDSWMFLSNHGLFINSWGGSFGLISWTHGFCVNNVMNVYLLVQTNDDIRVESISQKMYILFLCRSGCSERINKFFISQQGTRKSGWFITDFQKFLENMHGVQISGTTKWFSDQKRSQVWNTKTRSQLAADTKHKLH